LDGAFEGAGGEDANAVDGRVDDASRGSDNGVAVD
jgi:hypothetical protein